MEDSALAECGNAAGSQHVSLIKFIDLFETLAKVMKTFPRIALAFGENCTIQPLMPVLLIHLRPDKLLFDVIVCLFYINFIRETIPNLFNGQAVRHTKFLQRRLSNMLQWWLLPRVYKRDSGFRGSGGSVSTITHCTFRDYWHCHAPCGQTQIFAEHMPLPPCNLRTICVNRQSWISERGSIISLYCPRYHSYLIMPSQETEENPSRHLPVLNLLK